MTSAGGLVWLSGSLLGFLARQARDVPGVPPAATVQPPVSGALLPPAADAPSALPTQPVVPAVAAGLPATRRGGESHRGRLWLVVAAAGLGCLAVVIAFVVLPHLRRGTPTTSSARVSSSARPASAPSVPAPDLAGLLPRNYTVVKALSAPMAAGAAPEEIVASRGPLTGPYGGWHQDDLQILAWDPVAKLWTVAFDARHVTAPSYLSFDSTNGWPYAGTVGSSSGNPTLLPADRADQLHQLQLAELTIGGKELDILLSRHCHGA